MLKVNEYFEGKVKSIGFQDTVGTVSIGVMEPGAYTFSTGDKERMQVISGELIVRLPDSKTWETFTAGSSFDVPGNASFDLEVETPTSYLCRYG